MSKKVSWVFVACLLCMQMQLSAGYGMSSRMPYPDSCDCCCSEWNIYADYIYWRPSRCDLDYAMTGAADLGVTDTFLSSLGGAFETVEPNFHSGYRLGLTKCFDNLDLGIHYTCLSSSDSDRVVEQPGANDNILLSNYPIQELVEQASGDYNLDLDIAEAEYGYSWGVGCRGSVRTFGGFKYLGLDQTLTSTIFDPVGDDFIIGVSSVDLNAYGLYMGMGGEYLLAQFCGCGSIGFFGAASLGGLYGQSKGTQTIALASNGTLFENRKDRQQVWIGNIDVGAGLRLVPLWDCINILAGYEFHGFMGTPGFPRRAGLEGTATPSCVTTGFDGLFVRVALNYAW